MNLNNFTIKAQEILHQAQQLAFNEQNPNIETAHLLKTLLDDKDGPIPYLLKKNNVNIGFVEEKLNQQIARLPKLQGGDPAQSVTREVNNVILKSGAVLKEFGDEFVAVEHMLRSEEHTSELQSRENLVCRL